MPIKFDMEEADMYDRKRESGGDFVGTCKSLGIILTPDSMVNEAITKVLNQEDKYKTRHKK
ncbi:MAG TPA: hypothetical protein ENG87_04985 [Candidatus Pacearchaeota archaeon]|nr:hypothetical protein [Candidatus Pacearchaeota archaeon]HDZ60929.1 hypothetical protein [Candidatus Pacearchaeota archaeon]